MKNLALWISLLSLMTTKIYSQQVDTCAFNFEEYFSVLNFSKASLEQFKKKKVAEITVFTTNNLKIVYTLNREGRIANQSVYDLKTKLRRSSPPKTTLIAKVNYEYTRLENLKIRHYKMLKKKRLYQECYDSIVYNSKEEIQHYYAFNINGRRKDSIVSKLIL